MTRNLLVWDAIIAWRDVILEKDVLRNSKTDYLSNMAKLIEIGLLDLEQPLTEFLKIRPEEKLRIIDENKWSQSTKLSRRTIFRSFYRFAQKKIKPTKIVIPFKEFRDIQKVVITELLSSNEIKAQSQSLTKDDILHLLEELCKINPRDSLICWMMWEYKATLHQVLDLQIEDVDFNNGIKFKDELRLGEMKPNLKQCLEMFIEGRSGLLFCTKAGKSIHAGQIVRTLRSASKMAKLPIIISPKILYAYAKAYGEKVFLEISEEDHKKYSKILEKKKHKLITEKLKNVFAD